MSSYSFDLNGVDISAENLKQYDCAVGTDYVDFDYDMIAKNVNLIIDTRGSMRTYLALKTN